MNFGHIEPALQCTKDALKDLKTGETLRADLTPEGISLNNSGFSFFFYSLVLFLTHCVSDNHITGRLSPISYDVAINKPTHKWAATFEENIDSALITNLENRFAKVQVVVLFSIL